MSKFVQSLFGAAAIAFWAFQAALGTSMSAAELRWGDWPRWGDQGDGTYRNPVLPSDYSDLDCIRVGSDYYAISSTFQYSPGMVVLHSKDLVNWRIAGHVVDDLTQIGPELNWDRMNRYGRGIWAGAIRHRDGNFRVYFGTPDEGYFMSTAKNPAGPWEPLHRVLDEAGWDDCCPFWDDDGQGYFVGTSFKDGYKTWLFKLTPDGRDFVPGWRVLLNEGSHREANKLYKIKDAYYHFYSEHKGGVGRYVMMQRATNIAGPYLEKRQLSHAQREAHEPNQGGIVQTEQGDWYFLTHHGSGDWEGRCASLLPVTWTNGWPILGAVGSDGIGTMVWSARKPAANAPVVTPQTDDDFNGPKLGAQWEWNYQPRADKWSLAGRPGFLRLHAFKPLQRDDLKKAGNTLTQRVLRTSTNVVTLALDVSGMADGQVAGLCHYSKDFGTIGVRRERGITRLESARSQAVTRGSELTTRTIWLRSTWGLDGRSRFAYSTNGTDFIPLGETYQLGWGDYRGARIGIFTYNNDAEAGYVDCDFLTYRYDSPATHTEPSVRLPSRLKIMPLGDSITCGYPGTNGGYRGLLHDLLAPVTDGFAFVGSSTNAWSITTLPAIQWSNEGHGSYGINNILTNLDGFEDSLYRRHGGADRNPNGGHWFDGMAFGPNARPAVYPDLILLLVGANERDHPEGAQDRLDRLISKIVTLRPDARLLVARITPIVNNQGHVDFVATYNQQLDAVVAKYAANRRVSLVDLNTGFPADGLSRDRLHPNDTGYNWMARQWYEAIISSFPKDSR